MMMRTLPSSIALVGIPYDAKSSYLQGPAFAPNRIREILHSSAHNYWTETLVNPVENKKLVDFENLSINTYFDIETQISEIINKGYRTLSLGGDHSITYPIIRAHRQFYEHIQILQIDAHGDLYDELDGDPYSHACPFARILEEKLAVRLVQVGIRTMNPHQWKQVEKYGVVEVIEMKDFEQGERPVFNQPLYISLDLDGLDPAFAPGVSHHEPGGLTTREVLRLIQNINVPIIGADVVELNPHRDLSNMTAAVAAKLVKEIAAKMMDASAGQ